MRCVSRVSLLSNKVIIRFAVSIQDHTTEAEADQSLYNHSICQATKREKSTVCCRVTSTMPERDHANAASSAPVRSTGFLPLTRLLQCRVCRDAVRVMEARRPAEAIGNTFVHWESTTGLPHASRIGLPPQSGERLLRVTSTMERTLRTPPPPATCLNQHCYAPVRTVGLLVPTVPLPKP